MSFLTPKTPKIPEVAAPTPPPNAPRQASAQVVSQGSLGGPGATQRSGTSTLIGTSPTGLQRRATTTKRTKFGGS